MKKFIILVISILAESANVIFAASEQGDITSIVSEIISNNPDLKARRLEIEQSRLETSDANSLNNPEVGVTQVWGRRGIGNKFEVEVSQSFDWPGVYRARSNAAKKGYAASEMLLLSDRLNLALEAKLKLVELVYMNQQLSLLNRIKENTNSVQAKVEEGFRGGELTILDTKKMQIEQYKIENEITILCESIFNLKEEIHSLCPGLELKLDGLDTYPVEPRLSEDEYFNQISTLDPVIAAGNLTIRQEDVNAKVATLQRLPGFSLGYIYQSEMGDVFNGFSVSMSLPFFQNRKAKATAKSRAENARLSNISATASRRAEIMSALHSLEVHSSQITSYERVFGDNSYLNLLLQAYQGGQINVIDYLAEVNYFYEATRSYLECKYHYCIALTSLNRYSLLQSIH